MYAQVAQVVHEYTHASLSPCPLKPGSLACSVLTFTNIYETRHTCRPGASGPVYPQFLEVLKGTAFLGVGGGSEFRRHRQTLCAPRRVSLWKAVFDLIFCLLVIIKKKWKSLFACCSGEFLADHNSETGFGHSSRDSPDGHFIRFSDLSKNQKSYER